MSRPRREIGASRVGKSERRKASCILFRPSPVPLIFLPRPPDSHSMHNEYCYFIPLLNRNTAQQKQKSLPLISLIATSQRRIQPDRPSLRARHFLDVPRHVLLRKRSSLRYDSVQNLGQTRTREIAAVELVQ